MPQPMTTSSLERQIADISLVGGATTRLCKFSPCFSRRETCKSAHFACSIYSIYDSVARCKNQLYWSDLLCGLPYDEYIASNAVYSQSKRVTTIAGISRRFTI